MYFYTCLDSSAVLTQTVDLASDVYKVPVEVKDLQGSGEVQIVTVRLCECENDKCKDRSVSTKLGVLGILALILGPLLLLLLCKCPLLVMFCITNVFTHAIESLISFRFR